MTKTALEVGDLLSVLGTHGLSLRGEALARHICDKPTAPGSGLKDLTGQLKHVHSQTHEDDGGIADTILLSLDVSNSAQSLRRQGRSFTGADAPSLSLLAGDANRPNHRQVLNIRLVKPSDHDKVRLIRTLRAISDMLIDS